MKRQTIEICRHLPVHLRRCNVSGEPRNSSVAAAHYKAAADGRCEFARVCRHATAECRTNETPITPMKVWSKDCVILPKGIEYGYRTLSDNKTTSSNGKG